MSEVGWEGAAERRRERTRQASADLVAGMPRRTAHALHALLEASREHNMPVTAAEVCVYDAEATSVLSTGSALREAQRKGFYCVRTPGGYWTPANRAAELRAALEDRYLRETERPGDAVGASPNRK